MKHSLHCPPISFTRVRLKQNRLSLVRNVYSMMQVTADHIADWAIALNHGAFYRNAGV